MLCTQTLVVEDHGTLLVTCKAMLILIQARQDVLTAAGIRQGTLVCSLAQRSTFAVEVQKAIVTGSRLVFRGSRI